ncbi:hypothetical protein AAE478_004170 [Parahypoxylon ruwenzoriense]
MGQHMQYNRIHQQVITQTGKSINPQLPPFSTRYSSRPTSSRFLSESTSSTTTSTTIEAHQYSCLCNEHFNNNITRELHILQEHSRCPSCSRKFPDRTALQHRQPQTARFYCWACDCYFPRPQIHAQNLQMPDRPRRNSRRGRPNDLPLRFKCPHRPCTARFAKKAQVIRHMREHLYAPTLSTPLPASPTPSSQPPANHNLTTTGPNDAKPSWEASQTCSILRVHPTGRGFTVAERYFPRTINDGLRHDQPGHFAGWKLPVSEPWRGELPWWLPSVPAAHPKAERGEGPGEWDFLSKDKDKDKDKNKDRGKDTRVKPDPDATSRVSSRTMGRQGLD